MKEASVVRCAVFFEGHQMITTKASSVDTFGLQAYRAEGMDSLHARADFQIPSEGSGWNFNSSVTSNKNPRMMARGTDPPGMQQGCL